MRFLVLAHAFGQTYTLPLPVWLYLYSGGAAVLVSFLLFALLLKSHKPEQKVIANINLNRSPYSELVFLGKSLSLLFFFLTLISGIWGDQLPLTNFAVNFFWIGFLLGFTYLTIIFGNLWQLFSPLKILTQPLSRINTSNKSSAIMSFLPFIGYLMLICLELIFYRFSTQPSSLSLILLTYTGFNFLAVLKWGFKSWHNFGEVFNTFFAITSHFSPLEITDQEIRIRSGLARPVINNLSLAFLILLILSGTAFDGIKESQSWINLGFNRSGNLEQIILLSLCFGLFLGFYFLGVYLMKVITKTKLEFKYLLTHFVSSLIPIAIAYHLAHYLSLLLIPGQGLVKLISDPLNLNWNLFDTASYQTNINLISIPTLWHLEVLIIILGHIISVYLAHKLALSIFNNSRQTLLSQLPMVILMIGYTITGLWILSQPVGVGLK